jgi:hydrogenase maturation protease
MRTLIAGFGNPLRGDDGFGVEVVRRLQQEALGDDVTVVDVGTGGIHLAHELLTPYDQAIIVDAMMQGGAPGTLHVQEVLDIQPEARVDLHLVLPARALGVAKALGALPARVLLIGCEPTQVDELSLELSPPVAAAVDTAVQQIRQLLSERTVSQDSA